MKGTPETPQCGFSRASIQILGLQGVDPKKFVAFNVLEDPELRQGQFSLYFLSVQAHAKRDLPYRCQGIFGLAHYPSTVFGQGIRWRV